MRCMSDDATKTPTPGTEAAPDDASEPADGVTVNEDGTITKREESGVGPGAGESPVVRVTVPVQHEEDEVTQHPTLGEQ
jgi:hypothetical protein